MSSHTRSIRLRASTDDDSASNRDSIMSNIDTWLGGSSDRTAYSQTWNPYAGSVAVDVEVSGVDPSNLGTAISNLASDVNGFGSGFPAASDLEEQVEVQ